MKANRRDFISKTSKMVVTAGLAGITFNPAALAGSKKSSANEKIRIGLIGARNMGFGILNHALDQPDVECAGIADIDEGILNSRAEEVMKKQGKKPVVYKDFRKLLENKEVDAVIIGTPDHWHCLCMVYACQSGKDVYVEKPMANSIAECEVMVKAARKYKRVVQVGQQQRSGEHWQQIMDFIKQGNIGQLRKVQIWSNFGYGVGQPVVADEPVPAGVDFEMWLGPAPERTFNKSRFHGSWRMFWNYGGGLMTDWGVHLIDMGLWVKDITTPPMVTAATGGNFSFPDHDHETFDTMSVSWQMKDYSLSWEHTAGIQSGPYGRLYGLAFIGNDATLVADRSGWELFPELGDKGYKVPALPKQQTGRENHAEHVKNWLECIKTRKDPNCTVETGKNVAMYAHMGNIALRTQTSLVWDENTFSFGNNKAANALITPVYRKPWEFPKI